MKLALAHFVGLLFASGMMFAGRLMLRYPDRTVRAFHFGTEPAFEKRLGLMWAKASGWLFAVMGAVGIILFLVMIPVDFAER